ncbi:CpaF family protein, partial [Corallococcus sp. CA031C]
PFAGDTDGGPASEPLVQVADDLLAEEIPPRHTTPPPRRPAPAPARSAPSSSNNVRTAAAPPRRPPGPPPPPDDEDDDDLGQSTELNTSEKTQIRPAPERPRR